MPVPGTTVLDARALFERVGLQSGMRVADLGCGVTGHYIIPAAQIVGGDGAAFAVDIQQSALQATESRAKLTGVVNIQYIWSNLERFGATKIPEASLDVALFANSLHLIRDHVAVFREAKRLTKIGGRILVVEWKPDATTVGPAVEQRVSPDALQTAAREVGLDSGTLFEAGPYHFGLVFTKA